MGNDPPRKYSEEEAAAILRRALERKELAEEVSHDELVEAAKEVGLSPADLEAAVVEEQKEKALATEREAWVRRRNAALTAMLVPYVVVNALLFTIDWLTGGGWWFYWALIPWGAALLMSAPWLSRRPSREKLLRRHERRMGRLRRAQRRAELRHGVRAFEEVVEHGVAAFLEHLEERRRLAGGRPRKKLPPEQ